MQATFDDEVVYTFIELESEASSERKRVAVTFPMNGINKQEVKVAERKSDDLDPFNDIRGQVEVNTEQDADKKYLNRSSYRMMQVSGSEDFRFTFDRATNSIIERR